MAKKINMSNLTNMTTDPLMDQTLGKIVGKTVNEASETTESSKRPSNIAAKKSTAIQSDASKGKNNNKSQDIILSNYKKKKVEIEGVGVVEKLVSEKGKIMGRPSIPISEKKKTISFTLSPEIYDLVKKRAAADRRSTSEYIAIIVEEYLSNS